MMQVSNLSRPCWVISAPEFNFLNGKCSRICCKRENLFSNLFSKSPLRQWWLRFEFKKVRTVKVLPLQASTYSTAQTIKFFSCYESSRNVKKLSSHLVLSAKILLREGRSELFLPFLFPTWIWLFGGTAISRIWLTQNDYFGFLLWTVQSRRVIRLQKECAAFKPVSGEVNIQIPLNIEGFK